MMKLSMRWLVLVCTIGATSVRADIPSTPSAVWYLREPVRAGYQNWGASDAVAERMTRAGLNTMVWAWNAWREPADPDNGDYTIRVMDKPMGDFLRWPALAKKHGLRIVVELDIWAGDERKFFDAKRNVRRVINAEGESGGATCPREPAFWEYIAQSIKLMTAIDPPIDGAVIDTETYNAGTIYPGYGALEYRCCYCDACFDGFAAKNKLDVTSGSVKPKRRYGWLLSTGRLSAYFTWLEDEMAAIALGLAKRIRADHPDFALGILNLFGPGDWYGLGLARGFADPRLPALVFSEAEYHTGYRDRTEAQMTALHNRNIPFCYVGGLMLSILEADEMAAHALELCRRTNGYWLFCSNTLFNTEEQLAKAKPPWNLKAGTIADYVKVLGAVQETARRPEAGERVPLNLLDRLESQSDEALTAAAAGLIVQVQGHDTPQQESFDDAKSVADWEGYYATPVWDRAIGRHRPGSLILTNSAQGAINRPAQVAKVISTQPNRTYHVSAHVKTECVLGRNGCTLRTGERRINGRLFNTYDWRPLSGESTSDETGKLRLVFHMHYTQGAAWLDDLTVSPIREQTWSSRPWRLNQGKGRFIFDALIPDGMEVKVKLVRADNRRMLVRNLRTGRNLGELFDLFGDITVQLELTVRSWEDGTLWVRRLAVE